MNPVASRGSRSAWVLGLLAGLLVVAFVLHLGMGSVDISPIRVVHELLRGPSDAPSEGNVNSIIWQTRFPRCLACMFVGGILGTVGSAFQAQLRNPISEPYVIGVSSGAAVGAALCIQFGWSAITIFAMPLCGFVGGMLTLFAVLSLARRSGAIARDSLILAGVVVGSFLTSVLTMVMLGAGQDTNTIFKFLLGDVGTLFWPNVWLLGSALTIGTAVLLSQSRRLNALAFGEASARQMGVNVNRLTLIVLATGTAMTAVTVGAVGIIGFVGLVAPHIARRVVGVDWRWSLPGSLLVGGILLSIADIVSQRLLSTIFRTPGLEPPVGLVTAFVGAPVLLYLLKQKG